MVKINSAGVLYSEWNNDECYTPHYWVTPIIKYVPKYKKTTASIIDIDKLWDSRFYYNKYNEIPVVMFDDEFVELDLWWRWHDVVPMSNVKLSRIKNIIWCPFDDKDSLFVKEFRKQWYFVIYSHINDWQDFYTYEPQERDIIVSNPPFTNKRKIFERCLSFDKPFALLMTNTWLNDAAPKQLFKEKDLQLLMFEQRMKFISPDGRENNKITFSSSYYCYNLLPKQIIMESLF